MIMPGDQSLTDVQLLDAFVAGRDDVAFCLLVTRHGPMVRKRCRRVLHDAHDADDAFQATFLVLWRRAASIQFPNLLGPWLRGVACRIAHRIRIRTLRRRQREGSLEAMPLGPPLPDDTEDELRLLIAEELSRLPQKYRLPIVLCYWEGLTHEEAADRLAWPVGTVKVRLVRGRAILRGRLDLRGISVVTCK